MKHAIPKSVYKDWEKALEDPFTVDSSEEPDTDEEEEEKPSLRRSQRQGGASRKQRVQSDDEELSGEETETKEIKASAISRGLGKERVATPDYISSGDDDEPQANDNDDDNKEEVTIIEQDVRKFTKGQWTSINIKSLRLTNDNPQDSDHHIRQYGTGTRKREPSPIEDLEIEEEKRTKKWKGESLLIHVLSHHAWYLKHSNFCAVWFSQYNWGNPSNSGTEAAMSSPTKNEAENDMPDITHQPTAGPSSAVSQTATHLPGPSMSLTQRNALSNTLNTPVSPAFNQKVLPQRRGFSGSLPTTFNPWA